MNQRGEYGRPVNGWSRNTLIGQTYDDIYVQQLADFRKLRGFDEMDEPAPGTGGRLKIPRTTNADVIGLADYWDKELFKATEVVGLYKRFSDSPVVKRWNQTMVPVNAARAQHPRYLGQVYPRNNNFWRDIKRLSIDIAIAKESPSPWGMIKSSIVQSAKNLPGGIYDVSTKGADVVRDKTVDAAKKAAEGAGDIAKSVLSSFAIPLLIGGGVIGTYFIVKAVRSPKAHGAR